MENKFTTEQLEKAKTCKSVEELLTVAKENGFEMTEAEATNLFAKLNPENGELSDNELETVSGGCGEIPTCPSCKSSDVTSNDGGEAPQGTTPCLEFRCLNCGHCFDK